METPQLVQFPECMGHSFLALMNFNSCLPSPGTKFPFFIGVVQLY